MTDSNVRRALPLKLMIRENARVGGIRKNLYGLLPIWQGSTASAIFADGFVDEGVELVAGERDMRAG
jgi:hypothetical protein